MNTILRTTMQPAARRVRAYFAPVDRNTSTPTPFNFARDAMFPLDSPPTTPTGRWIASGWISNFTRTPTTKVTAVRSGAKAAPSSQFRAQLGAEVQFEFRQWGKLQMALACGSEQMNILKPDLDADPTGATLLPTVPLLAGSTATQLLINPASLAAFSVGALIAVDVDYVSQTGYVGSGITAAYVQSGASIHWDPNYIRRVTFNVARIASLTPGSTAATLTLAQPLLGGTPQPGAKAQLITGFTDREGGPFTQEWSALFVIPDELGGRVLFYYPRLQASVTARENALEIGVPRSGPVLARAGSELLSWSQPASFIALPTNDPIDGQQIVCQRAYFPALSAALY